MNKDEAKRLVDELFAAYPNAPTHGRRRRVVVDAWSPHLQGIDPSDGSAAVGWLVEHKPFLPALAEVLEACRMVHRDRSVQVGRPPDPLLDVEEPDGGYVTLTDWKARREVSGP